MGWDRWTPVNAAAIGAHIIGASGVDAGSVEEVRLREEAQMQADVDEMFGIFPDLKRLSKALGWSLSGARRTRAFCQR